MSKIKSGLDFGLLDTTIPARIGLPAKEEPDEVETEFAERMKDPFFRSAMQRLRYQNFNKAIGGTGGKLDFSIIETPEDKEAKEFMKRLQSKGNALLGTPDLWNSPKTVTEPKQNVLSPIGDSILRRPIGNFTNQE